MSMRPIVLRCREMLRAGRERARELHLSEASGIHVSTQLADLYDSIVLEVWQAATAQCADDKRVHELSLVAHGGFGRRDLSPYSDADLMLLTTSRSEHLAGRIAGDLTRDLGDAGIAPGLSVRSPDEACRLAWDDPVVFTSLCESRFLAGSLQLYARFFDAFRLGAQRRRRRLIREVVAARLEERQKWGETNYLLRPNVKRSRGGLRDIQLIRWIGFANYGETDLEQLIKLGVVPEEDYRQLRAAYAFLLRLRHELHFRERKSQDVLDRPTQVKIAAAWGYRGCDGMLPVEQFMQDYFDNTRNVRYASGFFVDHVRSRPVVQRAVERALSRKLDDRIRMGPTLIWVQPDRLRELATSLADVLHLMSLANHHRRRISHQTWQAIRLAMQERPPTEPDAESIAAFLSLLSQPGRLAPLLRRLHELRIIEQLIPEFRRMRGLLQFNAYHQYTVDAHSILAVEAATSLEHEPGGMGRRYRRQEDKTLLHLALLIHDIGKGHEEDHCIVGGRIARQVAQRLQLGADDADTLEWLVLKHLDINVVAFRHNLNDPQILLSFAREVGSIRRLELLTVHTYCDLTAVGPGVATDWKVNLIEELYRRTRRYFDSGDLPGSPDDPEIESKRSQLVKHLQQLGCVPECYQLLDQMPLSLLGQGEPERLARAMKLVSEHFRDQQSTICRYEYEPDSQTTRYSIIRREHDLANDTFARACGALSASGVTIMRANIEMVGDLAWDDFWVVDLDYPDQQPPADRMKQIADTMRQYLDAPERPLPPPRQTWSTGRAGEGDSVKVLPRKVVFDNDTIDTYTIISFFDYNQVGLLHRIAASLSQQQLVLHFAKIDTHIDQVADVFYVTERDGSRITDPQRQQEIRAALLAVTV